MTFFQLEEFIFLIAVLRSLEDIVNFTSWKLYLAQRFEISSGCATHPGWKRQQAFMFLEEFFNMFNEAVRILFKVLILNHLEGLLEGILLARGSWPDSLSLVNLYTCRENLEVCQMLLNLKNEVDRH